MMDGDRSQNKKCAECRVPMFDWQNDGTIDPVIADRPAPPNPRIARARRHFEAGVANDTITEIQQYYYYDGQFPWTDIEQEIIQGMITTHNTTRPTSDFHYQWVGGGPGRSFDMGSIRRINSPHRQAIIAERRRQAVIREEARRRAQREARNARRRAQRQAQRAGQPAPAGTRVRHCSVCGNTGHDRRTCPQR